MNMQNGTIQDVDNEADAVQQADTAIRLNIGGGDVPMPGYTLIDRNVGKEAYPLDYPDNSVTEIYASHVLEHFPHRQTEAVLNEWARVLKPGGRLRLAVPDHYALAKHYIDGTPGLDYAGFFYGGQMDENDYHKAGFDEFGLPWFMRKAGLVGIRRWDASGRADCSRLPISLNLEGFKAADGAKTFEKWRDKTICVRTVPRLGFSANHRCHSELISRQGIRTLEEYGVYVGQCFERLAERAIKDGAEWILALDYDSVFNQSILERLFVMFDTHPEIDALAPMEAMRGNDAHILLNSEKVKTIGDLNEDVLPVRSAHFGLTLLRAAAFAKLSKPWFIDVPNEAGTWGEGRKDADINFWHKWTDAGNTVAVAPHIGIGHIQENVVWLDANMGRRYQQWPEFFNSGMKAPPGCRS